MRLVATNKMEVYRSGHNGPDSKSGIQQCIVGSNPTASANKKRTFGRQKFSFCLSIAKAMAHHHASSCISSPQAYIITRKLYFFRNDDKQNFVFMIYNFSEIDDIQGNALIYLQKYDIF